MPNDVISPARLAQALAGNVPVAPHAASVRAVAGAAPVEPPQQRTAVLIVHGISRIQRYAVQDQFADGLVT